MLLVSKFFRFIAYLIFIAGGGICQIILFFQIFDWLRLGTWESKPFLYFLYEVIELSWLISPQDWFGLHSAMNSVNAGIGIFCAAAAISIVLIKFSDFLREEAYLYS